MNDTAMSLRKLLHAHQLLRTISAQGVSTLANQMVAFIIPWLVLSRTGSALSAGTVTFITTAGAVVSAMFGGVIVDRIGRRKASIISDTLSFFTIIILPITLLFDFLPLWLIIVTQTLGVLFDGPGRIAKDTLIPRTAKIDKIPLVRATSLQETLQGMATFAGPLLAGFTIAIFSESTVLFGISVLFLVGIILIIGIKREQVSHDTPMTPARAVKDTREGFAFLFKESLLRPLTILCMIFVAVYLPVSTIIFPAWYVLAHQTAGALGIFLGAQALGGILGGLVFAVIAPKISRYLWFIMSALLSSLLFGILAFLQPGSLVAIGISFLNGAASAGALPIVNTAYYSRTPAHLLGRISGTSWALMLAASAPASLLFGWVIHQFSANIALIIVALTNLAISCAIWLIPAMKLLDDKSKSEGR